MTRNALIFYVTLLCGGVFAQEKNPWVIGGTASLNLNLYNQEGINNRREPFRYNLGLYPVFSKGNWRIPVRVTVYNLGIGSDYQVARFGVQPSWKWGSLHLGHSNVRFSNFTQNGRTLFGLGAEINPGLFRFGVLWGTTRQTGNSILSNAVQPNVYPQEVFSMKVGVGNRNHFLDLIYLKGKDDATETDSTKLMLDQYPEENLVLAARTEHYFFKRKWAVGGEFALSGLTSNQNSTSLSDVSDESPTIPSWLLEPKVATLIANAAEAFVGYNGRRFNSKLTYQRISPGFRSFGAYYFQDDIESVDLSFGIKLLKNKLRIKTRAGLRQNNLANDKSLKTTRARGFLQLYYRPSRSWLYNATYSNYQTEQSLQDITNRDSLRTTIVSNNINGTVQNALVGKKRFQHIFRLNAGFLTSADRNESRETKNYSAGLQYQLITASNNWQWQVGIDYLGFEQVQFINHRYGNRLEVVRNLKQGKWRVGAYSHQVWSYRGALQSGASIVPGLHAAYRPSIAHSFSLRMSYSIQSFTSATATDFTELQAAIKYSYRFGVKKG